MSDILKKLLDASFQALQHDTGPSDPEYVHLRSVLSDKFKSILKSRRNTRAESAEVEKLKHRNTELELKLRAADEMARICDDWVMRGEISSRSALADARLNYGQPHKYEASQSAELQSLKKEVAELQANLKTAVEDWAEHDTDIREICEKAGFKAYSDDDCNMPITEPVEALADELQRLREVEKVAKAIIDYGCPVNENSLYEFDRGHARNFAALKAALQKEGR